MAFVNASFESAASQFDKDATPNSSKPDSTPPHKADTFYAKKFAFKANA
jgi:hypothetical protein